MALVAYRPLERGRLTAEVSSEDDRWFTLPKQDKGAVPRERLLMETLRRIALEREKSVSQVALNWLLARDEHVIPIPGATSARHALENAGALTWDLSDDEFAAIDQASSP